MIKVRKRHTITDIQGLLLSVKVHAANSHDSKAVFEVIKSFKYRFGWMKTIYADSDYRGELIDNVNNKLGYNMKITLRSDKSTKFSQLLKRSIAESSFARFDAYRRLSKYYERTCCATENMIYIAFNALMIKQV